MILNKTLQNEKNEISSDYKEIIMTNRWIAGLSLVSVFVVVSLIYTKVGLDMSPNNNN